MTVAFIGGGFAGLVTGARLKEAGVDDVRIIEKGGDFGGTWYWNRYPGAQCDTESFVYMPLLEETGYMPNEKYVYAPEILEHCQRIGKQFDLYDNALFHTEVTELEWDDRAPGGSSAPTGATRSPPVRRMGTGPLHARSCPASPASRSSRATRSTPAGGTTTTPAATRRARLDRLADKRVGIIGTGATGGAVHPAPGASPRRSCTSSSARRRRSTCATTGRLTRSGSPNRSRRDGSSAGSRTSPPSRRRLADEDR